MKAKRQEAYAAHVTVAGRVVLREIMEYYKTKANLHLDMTITEKLDLSKWLGDDNVGQFLLNWDRMQAILPASFTVYELEEMFLQECEHTRGKIRPTLEVYYSNTNPYRSFEDLKVMLKEMVDRERVQKAKQAEIARILGVHTPHATLPALPAPAQRQGQRDQPQDRGHDPSAADGYARERDRDPRKGPRRGSRTEEGNPASWSTTSTATTSSSMAGKGGKGESARDISKTPCRYYSRGTCWKGSECPYLHEGNIPQGQPKGKGKVQQQATVETQPRHSGDVALAAENQRLHNRLSTQFWCTEFLKGDCQRGAGCDYLHLDSEQVGKLKAFRKKLSLIHI